MAINRDNTRLSLVSLTLHPAPGIYNARKNVKNRRDIRYASHILRSTANPAFIYSTVIFYEYDGIKYLGTGGGYII